MTDPTPTTGTVKQDVTPVAGPRRPADLEPGQHLDDFELLALLGQGGFAKVFLARQRSMQRIVALKVSADQGTEPQTLAQLDHPHIVRVYDQRVLPEHGLRLLYMPYLAGGTLKEVLDAVRTAKPDQRNGKLLLKAVDDALARRGELPPTDSATRTLISTFTWPETVCWLGARLAEALDYAHQHGVLHRDLKPANVLLGADASPRLADFNVSSSNVDGAKSSFGGSLAYMSPEQLDAFNPAHDRTPESLDGRSDLYSLAVTLWELLTGRRPHQNEAGGGDGIDTFTTMAATRRSGTDTAIAKLPPEIPDGLRSVLVHCLAPEPEERPATALEVARLLDLARKPRSRALLFPAPGWRTWVARHPVLALYGVGLGVNGLAAWFSIEYNKAAIVDTVPATQDMFKRLQIILNGIFFPLCMLLFGVLIWPVVRGLRQSREAPLPPESLPALRRHCLWLGPGSVLVCLWAWVAAGVIFPVAMHYSVTELPARFHFHFVASQTLCGLIAVSYPQIIVSFLALRCFYPRFVRNALLAPDDLEAVRRLDRRQSFYLVLAVLIPFLALGLVFLFKVNQELVLGVLSIVGGLGFALAYYLTNQFHADRAALEAAVG